MILTLTDLLIQRITDMLTKMKVRIVRKPEFTLLHHVQVKHWWFPFWMDVSYDSLSRCREVAENLIKHGNKEIVLWEGETS